MTTKHLECEYEAARIKMDWWMILFERREKVCMHWGYLRAYGFERRCREVDDPSRGYEYPSSSCLATIRMPSDYKYCSSTWLISWAIYRDMWRSFSPFSRFTSFIDFSLLSSFSLVSSFNLKKDSCHFSHDCGPECHSNFQGWKHLANLTMTGYHSSSYLGVNIISFMMPRWRLPNSLRGQVRWIAETQVFIRSILPSQNSKSVLSLEANSLSISAHSFAANGIGNRFPGPSDWTRWCTRLVWFWRSRHHLRAVDARWSSWPTRESRWRGIC